MHYYKGQKVRIRSLAELEASWGKGVHGIPFGFNRDMARNCGKIMEITNIIGPEYDLTRNIQYNIRFHNGGGNWNELMIKPLHTKKYNTRKQIKLIK